MNRPIKFRAWHKTKKEWLYYSLADFLDDTWYAADVEDFEWSQFTGLHDKNGKEIWEGDVIKLSRYWQDECGREVSFVTFDEARFMLSHAEADDLDFFVISKEVEVLGNIYEHPHLLKESN